MSLLKEKIKLICKQKKITVKELASRLDMTEVGLHRSLENGTLPFKNIEKMASILRIDVNGLFDTSIDNSTFMEPAAGYALSDRELLEIIAYDIMEIKKKVFEKK